MAYIVMALQEELAVAVLHERARRLLSGGERREVDLHAAAAVKRASQAAR